jgi:hypothetical protein
MRGSGTSASISSPISSTSTIGTPVSLATIAAAITAHNIDTSAHGGVEAEVVAARNAGGKGSASLLANLNALWAAGTAGSLWWWGTSTPASGTGSVNDFYLNVTTGDVYEKTSVGWGSPVGNIMGPQGVTGATGGTGAPGATGATGAAGTNATIAPGQSTTMTAGSVLSVDNSGNLASVSYSPIEFSLGLEVV